MPRSSAGAYVHFSALLQVGLLALQAWTPSAQKMLGSWEGHDGMVRAVDFSPNGKYACSGGSIIVDDNTWSVKCYDISADDSTEWKITRELKPVNKKFRFEDQVLVVEFSNDGTRLAVGDEKGAHIFDSSSDNALEWQHIRQWKTHKDGWTRGLRFSLDGKRLFDTSDDQTTVMWDMSNPDTAEWTKRRILKGHREGNYGIAISPDGKMVATGGADNALRVWDITDSDPKVWKERELRNFTGHKRLIRSVQWSDDGKILATASDDRTARVYDVSSVDAKEWKLLSVLEGHDSTVPGLAISTGSPMYIATGSGDGDVRIYTPADEGRASWQLVGRFGCREKRDGSPPPAGCVGHIAALRGVRFHGSPSDKRFLLGSVSDDGFLKVWDMKTIGVDVHNLYGNLTDEPDLADGPQGSVENAKQEHGNRDEL